MSDPEYLRAAHEISMTADTPAASKDAPTDEAVERAMEFFTSVQQAARNSFTFKASITDLVDKGAQLAAHVATLTAKLEAERAAHVETRGLLGAERSERTAEKAYADAAVAEAKALREADGWRTDFENMPAYPARADLWAAWDGEVGHRFTDCYRGGKHWTTRDGKYVEKTTWYDWEGDECLNPDPDYAPPSCDVHPTAPRIKRCRIIAWRDVPAAPARATLAQPAADGGK